MNKQSWHEIFPEVYEILAEIQTDIIVIWPISSQRHLQGFDELMTQVQSFSLIRLKLD